MAGTGIIVLYICVTEWMLWNLFHCRHPLCSLASFIIRWDESVVFGAIIISFIIQFYRNGFVDSVRCHSLNKKYIHTWRVLFLYVHACTHTQVKFVKKTAFYLHTARNKFHNPSMKNLHKHNSWLQWNAFDWSVLQTYHLAAMVFAVLKVPFFKHMTN